MYHKLGQACVTKLSSFFYYKLGQTLLQMTALLLQTGASVVTNWGRYYKLGESLLQNKAALTN